MSYAAQSSRIIDNEQAYDAAVSSRIAAATRAKFHRENADSVEVTDFLYGASNWSEFAKSLSDSYESRGKLTEGQMSAARSMLAKSKARQAEREAAKTAPASSGVHIGTVGKREDFSITIGKIITLSGVYGLSFMHLCTDAAGNAIVYKGTTEIGKEGETVTVKATVKEHTAYNGKAQTILSRPKVL